ncbi:hypothetical protein P7C70_g4500, partial [Phenoliferia sp. Uapishka_3]
MSSTSSTTQASTATSSNLQPGLSKPSKHSVLVIVIPVVIGVSFVFGGFYLWIWLKVRKTPVTTREGDVEAGEGSTEMVQSGGEGGAGVGCEPITDGEDVPLSPDNRDNEGGEGDNGEGAPGEPPSYDPAAARPPGYTVSRSTLPTLPSTTSQLGLINNSDGGGEARGEERFGSRWWHWIGAGMGEAYFVG